ncbi:DUF1540 domain-containing protein [Terracoccus luteus]|uniref:Uncharacterized protein DUF1540 n=1 Tax=Terracoccus luteus TaxID=53356 RepID=A0A495XX30_9MICO|nr:DUF1540 domain-containing protein [Terracoccus luteus]MBB2985756.1 hypothetical protein [Terracoccus luteus]MCP2171408.1 hypothetical protein [Terracoccus luteus]RKT78512.1 uncharacterized protein DUF1540 [Terracoccus luteus]
MPTLSLPIVSTCSVSGCSYNHDHDCQAGAITVTGSAASCGTYVGGDAKGGVDGGTAMVGACHRTECVHNADLECSAEDISVGAGKDPADCLTFSAA